MNFQAFAEWAETHGWTIRDTRPRSVTGVRRDGARTITWVQGDDRVWRVARTTGRRKQEVG